ncbi:MAG: alanine racemase [Syntrophomonadaceae bacterium]|jgi:alanine racemase
MDKKYLTWAEIDISALHYNLAIIRNQLNPRTRIMAVVKANAYGHGAVEISQALVEHGVDALAVATISEAILLREKGVVIPILILGTVGEEDVQDLFEYRLMPSINSVEMASWLNESGRQRNLSIKVHLRVDTGMGSYGLFPRECLAFSERLAEMSYLELEGIYTHINTIYGGRQEDAFKQVARFEQVLAQLGSKGITIPIVHACSSPALFKLPKAEYDMVRPGIALYGLTCGNDLLDSQVRTVMQIKTRVMEIKKVGCDVGLGYGWTYTTVCPTQIATLPIGYADANFLHLLNKGEVLIHNQRTPIIGKVCMDHMIVDISNIEEVKIGDEVVILGQQGSQRISAEEIARQAGIDINNCDMVCLLSPRVPRVYKK